MHITLEADYAVRIVHCLASAGKRTDAKAIAQMTGVTLRFALKILRKLVAAGIVRSFKGTQGGYEIARPLEDISLKDVIETVEGPYALSRCVDDAGDYVCTNPNGGSCCSFHQIFAEISSMVNEKLAAVRFSDIMVRPKEEKPRQEESREEWDAYLPDGEPAGCTLYRDRPFPEGLFHIVSNVLVRHEDGSYLVMQRDEGKESHPGLFVAGAGGCVCKGETPCQGALRELREETGIEAENLTLLYSKSDGEHTFYFGFLCVTSWPKEAIVLQEKETVSYRWLKREEFLQFMQGPEFVPAQRERWLPFLDRV